MLGPPLSTVCSGTPQHQSPLLPPGRAVPVSAAAPRAPFLHRELLHSHSVGGAESSGTQLGGPLLPWQPSPTVHSPRSPFPTCPVSCQVWGVQHPLPCKAGSPGHVLSRGAPAAGIPFPSSWCSEPTSALPHTQLPAQHDTAGLRNPKVLNLSPESRLCHPQTRTGPSWSWLSPAIRPAQGQSAAVLRMPLVLPWHPAATGTG